MKKISLLITVLLLSTQSVLAQNNKPRRLDYPNNVDDAELCRNKRVAFINEHRKGTQPNYSNDEVTSSPTFADLCAPDRTQFRNITAATVRLFTDDGEGQTTGTLIDSNQILLIYPERSSNPWYPLIQTGKFKIKVINYNGEEAEANVISSKMLKSYTPTGVIFTLEKPLTKINPKIRPNAVTLGLPTKNVKYNHPLATFTHSKDQRGEQVVDVKEVNKQVFSFGYDDDEFNIGFGMSGAQNSLRCCAKSESDYYYVLNPKYAVTKTTYGGGLYNEDFELIGLHFDNLDGVNVFNNF